MIRDAFSRYVGGLRDLLARTLVAFNPNFLTFLGLIFNIVVAVLFAFGHIIGGGYMMLLSGALDVLDGAVARASKRITRFGAFFDSIMDRYSDLAVFIGIMVYFASLRNTFYLVLTGIALTGTVMISYARARAELLIPKCKVGFMERPERHITLMIGAMSNHLVTAIWILAITTHIDAIYRIFYARREINRLEREEASARTPETAGTATASESASLETRPFPK